MAGKKSKNDAKNRGNKQISYFNGKEVIPGRFKDTINNIDFIAVQLKETGDLVFPEGSDLPMAWDQLPPVA